MTGKEEFVNTLTGKPHRTIPFQELEVSSHVVDAVLEKRCEVLSTDLPVDDYAEFTLRTNQYAFYHPAVWKAGRVYKRTSSGLPVYVDGFVKSLGDIARIEEWNWHVTVSRLEELVSEAKKHGFAVIMGMNPPYSHAKTATGYQDFLLKFYDDPDFVLRLIDWFEERVYVPVENFLNCGMDVLVLAGDLCTGSGPMISEEMARKYWLPSTNRLAEFAKKKGIQVILHMDGDFSRVIDLIMGIPFDAFHPFEPCGSLDIYTFHEEYGDRITIMGNINLAGVLTRGTPEEVAEDVRRHIERLAEGGRYIVGSSHDISQDVPVENFFAMMDTVKNAAG